MTSGSLWSNRKTTLYVNHGIFTSPKGSGYKNFWLFSILKCWYFGLMLKP